MDGWLHDNAAGPVMNAVLYVFVLSQRGMSNADGRPHDSAAGPMMTALFGLWMSNEDGWLYDSTAGPLITAVFDVRCV